MTTFTPSELAACADREVKQRLRVFPRLVAKGSMAQALADRETAMMRQIAADYRERATADPRADGRIL